MAKLIEITPEQYDALLELGVPVWWTPEHVHAGDKSNIIGTMLAGGSCEYSYYKIIQAVDRWEHKAVVQLWTLEDSDDNDG